MVALSVEAMIMAAFGFVVLFGGLAVTLYVALSDGFGYEANDEDQDEESTGPT